MNIRLCSYSDLRMYMLADDTCKCGLVCPLFLEKTFSFDPHIASKAWTGETVDKDGEDLTNLCNHKRKTMAMATLQKAISQSTMESSESSCKGNYI